MYGFIDYLIEYKLNNNLNDLNTDDVSSLLDSYLIKRGIQKKPIMQRKIRRKK